MTPRDQAGQWLAGQIHATSCDGHGRTVGGVHPYCGLAADAILDAAGVETTTLAHPASDTSRTAILLPVARPENHGDGRTGPGERERTQEPAQGGEAP